MSGVDISPARRLREIAVGTQLYGTPDREVRAKQLLGIADDIDAALAQARAVPCAVMVDMTPPATSRDRWMYEQGRLAERDPRTHAAEARAVPSGWKLLKDTTHDERSWPEDYAHENGRYSSMCGYCGRMFLGHKRRGICRACAAAPSPADQPPPAVKP